MNVRYKNLKVAAILYVLLPVLVFYVGWLNPVSAGIFSVLAIAACLLSIRAAADSDAKFSSISLTKKQIVGIAVLAVLWCVLAGQGKFVAQTDDHPYRNAILLDLITKDWPVLYDQGESMMCYYIAHWMIPAAFGKLVFRISNSVFAGYLTGNIFLLIWSSLGCTLTLLLVTLMTTTGKTLKVLFALFLFIFFSGLDIVGLWVRRIPYELHMEWWSGYFQYSSNTTCLYWVYNQTIVPWVLMLCLMNEKKLKDMGLLCAFALPYAPFPFVGMVIFCFLRALADFLKHVKGKSCAAFFKDLLSPQNIMGVLSIILVYGCYYTTNARVATEGTGFRLYDSLTQALSQKNWRELFNFAKSYAAFIVLEVGVYIALILRRRKPDLVFVGMCISLLLIPLFQIGVSSDFCMRVSIPGVLYLCINFIQIIMPELPEKLAECRRPIHFLRQRKFLAAAMVIFVLGAATPGMEVVRQLYYTIRTPYREIIDYSTVTSLQDKGKDNFIAVGYEDSLYYKLFSKQVER